MKNTLYVTFFAITSAALLFSGCAYQTKKVTIKENIDLSYNGEKENIELTVKTTPEIERKSYFGKYVPLHLHVKNKNNETYVLDTNNISLPITSISEVGKKVPKVISSYFVPSALLTAGGIFFFWELCLPLAAISAITSFCLGVSHNKRTIKKLKKISLEPSQKIEIGSYSTVDKIIFIKKDIYTPQFELKFTNKKNSNKVEFNVFITEKKSVSFIV